MRSGKSPTRAQKILMSYYGRDPKEWLVAKSEPDKLVIVHKHTGTRETLPKERKI